MPETYRDHGLVPKNEAKFSANRRSELRKRWWSRDAMRGAP